MTDSAPDPPASPFIPVRETRTDVRITTAIKLSAYYHLLAFGATLLGGALIAGGLFLGLGGAASEIASGTLTPSAIGTTLGNAVGSIDPVPLVVLVVFGLLVRRIGRTAARLTAEAKAVDAEVETASTSVISRKVGREVTSAIDQGDIGASASEDEDDEDPFTSEGVEPSESADDSPPDTTDASAGEDGSPPDGAR